MHPNLLHRNEFLRDGSETTAYVEWRNRGIVPENRITEAIVVFLGSIFVKVDWKSTILCSQSLRHTFLVSVGNDHA